MAKATVTAGTCLLIFASCCAQKRAQLWTPLPTVHWEHVSTKPVRPVRDGYRLLVTPPTQGLFPASMAITRVTIQETEETGAFEPYLRTDPRNEFLQWNSTLDDQMAISEVFPIVDRDLGGREADPQQIVAAFRALHGKLGLIYAVNELSPTATEMFGVLYNAATAQPIASLHAEAVSIQPSEGPNPACAVPGTADRDNEFVDLWKTDSRALVREKFGRLVHACIRDLISQDQPADVETPTGWTPAGPIRPVEWPPRRFRTGR